MFSLAFHLEKLSVWACGTQGIKRGSPVSTGSRPYLYYEI